MTTESWRPLPGLTGSRYISLTSPSGLAGSNLSLLDLPPLFLLVDLGSSPEGVATVSRIMNEADPSGGKPLLVVLTHCHYDHIAAAPLLESLKPRPFTVAGHAAGIPPLAESDDALTLAYLFKTSSPSVSVSLGFFREHGNATGESRGAVPLGPDIQLTCTPPEMAPNGLMIQTLMACDQPVATIYATPGHSPDSICLETGDLFSCGDLLLAGNPGVAGIPGWNRSEFQASLGSVRSLLQEREGVLVCSGHGPVLSRDNALALVETALHRTGELDSVAVLDAERSTFLREYALALGHEAAGACTILAGRLLLVAEHLETLDEPARSREIRDAADLEAMDALIRKYAHAAGRDDRPGEPELRLALIAGETSGKLDRLLEHPLFARIIDPPRLRRVRNLFVDFRHALSGISCRNLLRPESPYVLLQALLADVAARPYGDSDFLATVDNHDLFLEELIRRMAFLPLIETTRFRLDLPDGLPPVCVDREHLLDTLLGLCELLAVSGGAQIDIAGSQDQQELRVTLTTETVTRVDLFTPAKVDFFRNSLRPYRIGFDVERQGDEVTVVLRLPVAAGGGEGAFV